MTATTIESGTSLLSPSVRLDPPTATTNRISSVAYAVDESASDAKMASALTFVSFSSARRDDASGAPMTMRLKLRSNFETGALPTVVDPGILGKTYAAFDPSGGGTVADSTGRSAETVATQQLSRR